MAVFNRVRLSGPIVSEERWSTHVDLTINPESDQGGYIGGYEALLTWAQAVAADNFWTTTNALRNLLSSAASLEEVRVEAIENGIVKTAAQVTGLALPGVGNMTKVPQTALVISSLTGRAGRSYRGRSYWPAAGAAVSTSTGRLSSPANSGVATDFKALVQMIASHAPGSPKPVPAVYSGKASVVTPVTQYEVGNVLDTQRRRRDKLVEARARVNY